MNDLDVIRIRKNLDLTQVEFAKILGVDRRTIINYEQGGKIPDSKEKLITMIVDDYSLEKAKPYKDSMADKNEVSQEDKMREIRDLKDHIITLKQFLEEKSLIIAYQKEGIDKLSLELQELKSSK
jgi:DNA-binding XRE family transcriptional regulator